MTNSKEILPQYRDQLELEITDTFLLALTKTTKTVREREPGALLPLYKLYTLFQVHFTTEKNLQHSRLIFLTWKERQKKQPRMYGKKLWTLKKLRTWNYNSRRTLSFEIPITPRIIGKHRGDYELKKKIRKGYVRRSNHGCNIWVHVRDFKRILWNRGRINPTRG